MKHITLKRLLPSTLALLAFTGCPSNGTDGEPCDKADYAQAHPEECGPQTRPPVCDQAAYDRANNDSAAVTQSDVSNALFAISPENTRLVWKDAEKSAVRVVVWTTFPGYTNDANGNYTFGREVFVTAAPQVQELCKASTLTGNDRANRINQYLGLPAEAENKRQIVELWVKPSDLFRPCPDAEITDTTCDLTYPATATDPHKSWLNNYFAGSHNPWQAVKYPFTGLGYTYDWCSGSTSPVGASEYIVKVGAIAQVIGYTTAEAYCAK
ncbi:hypothetical protein CYFUS_000447 [Cystobacter fuscus]|uniref:Lipoprotein n=1 Tax=Cystobacter fuscus TaxID=43 RepID=A0A250ITE7_9BACT|nr:hypothetical protein [Cystobacter fuscus]ATB35035.1 hypothetical protein CYFUS_000447 [Cystobacter fuscus]